MESRQVLRLFLASSSDVAAERKIVREVVDSWNRTIGIRRGWQVDVIGWDTHGAPDYGSDAQAILNRQIADMRRYALFVGILKHRFGTPTPRAASGTNEEFQRAVKAFQRTGRLRIMLYFCTAPIPHDADLEQKQKLQAFRKKVQPLSLHWSYRTQTEFRQLFGEHFNGWIEDHIKASKRKIRAVRTRAMPKAGRLKADTPKFAAPKAVAPKITRPSAPSPKSPVKTHTTRATPRDPATVSSSGLRLLLGDRIFRCRPVKGKGNQLTLPLLSSNGEEESILRRLCHAQSYNLIAYAHGRDGGQVRLNSCEHENQGNATLWSFQASLDYTARSGWMTLEDAERRARLLLLGPSTEPNTPTPQSIMWGGAGMIHRAGQDAPGLFAALWAKMAGNRSEFLYAAFLHAVQRLKSDGLCEDVLELKIGPIKNNALRVHFRGRIASGFSSSAQVIEIKGDCALAATSKASS